MLIRTFFTSGGTFDTYDTLYSITIRHIQVKTLGFFIIYIIFDIFFITKR